MATKTTNKSHSTAKEPTEFVFTAILYPDSGIVSEAVEVWQTPAKEKKPRRMKEPAGQLTLF